MFLNKFQRTPNKSALNRRRNHFKVIFRQVRSNFPQSLNNSLQNLKKSKVKSTHICVNKIQKATENNKSTQKIKKQNDKFRNLSFIRQQGNGNLYLKVMQIEKINNKQRQRRAEGKSTYQYNKECMQKKWQSYIKEEKITNSTYQNIKKMNLNKENKTKNKQVFVYLCNPDYKKSKCIDFESIKSVAKQKTSELCNFVAGFQDYATKLQFQQLSSQTNLDIFKRKLKKSEGISNIYRRLVKSKQFQSIRQSELNDDFLSTVFASQYVQKNGKNNEKSRSILKIAHCMI